MVELVTLNLPEELSMPPPEWAELLLIGGIGDAHRADIAVDAAARSKFGGVTVAHRQVVYGEARCQRIATTLETTQAKHPRRIATAHRDERATVYRGIRRLREHDLAEERDGTRTSRQVEGYSVGLIVPIGRRHRRPERSRARVSVARHDDVRRPRRACHRQHRN